jgi:peptidoglycan-associated lipoprotein
VIKRILGISLLAIVVGCAGPGADPTGGGEEGAGFGPEGTSDPGMEEGAGGSRGMEAAGDLRSIYFDFDRDDLKAAAKENLRHNAQILQDNPGLQVTIEGNCDERGSEEYNLALGMRRAETAKRYLVDLGVDGSRLVTVSFGEEQPAVRGSNEAAWAKNRRDDFKAQ